MITNNQYIVPTSSKPLRGLIQDHVCGGVRCSSSRQYLFLMLYPTLLLQVLMCMLDTFLTKQQYTQLLFSAAAILITPSHPRIALLPPAIMKPAELWTGKQVISSILHNLLPLQAFGPLTVSFKVCVCVCVHACVCVCARAHCIFLEPHQRSNVGAAC